MSVIIKMPNEPVNTYALIELQGDLKSQTETEFNGKFIGDLHFTKAGMPILIIGHHLMFGKESNLEKPLALLRKERSEDGSAEYTVRSIVTKKILFKTRPKPIVGTPKGKGAQKSHEK